MKLYDIFEARVHRDDPAMDDVYDTERRKERDIKDAPYFVRWHGQSHEWSGDDRGPERGEGRYKPKGDGGKIVAINVPTYEEAQKIATQLDRAYQDHRFPDDSVYADYGKDWYVVDYQGADIGSMRSLPRWELQDIQLYHKPKDYSK